MVAPKFPPKFITSAPKIPHSDKLLVRCKNSQCIKNVIICKIKNNGICVNCAPNSLPKFITK